MKQTEQDKGTTRILNIANQNITVLFQSHSVHITNDDALVRLLETNRAAVTEELVVAIKEQFKSLYAYELDISADSLAVEIWGHVYCAQLATIIQNLVRLKLLEKVTDKLIDYCAVIDCGEKGYDGNRFFWDMLAPFKSQIEGWLPDSEQPEDEVAQS